MAGPRPASPGAIGKGAMPSSREDAAAEGVGEEDLQGAQGFHVGLAPANLRPPQSTDTGIDAHLTTAAVCAKGYAKRPVARLGKLVLNVIWQILQRMYHVIQVVMIGLMIF